jgi:hypothetical protein
MVYIGVGRSDVRCAWPRFNGGWRHDSAKQMIPHIKWKNEFMNSNISTVWRI